jgi:hypothetical protein
MGKRITIEAAGVLSFGVLNETEAAAKIAEALPIESSANTWGEEIYFEIPVSAKLAPDATAEVSVGDIGYWPPGRALCIFFGKTPASARDWRLETGVRGERLPTADRRLPTRSRSATPGAECFSSQRPGTRNSELATRNPKRVYGLRPTDS